MERDRKLSLPCEALLCGNSKINFSHTVFLDEDNQVLENPLIKKLGVDSLILFITVTGTSALYSTQF